MTSLVQVRVRDDPLRVTPSTAGIGRGVVVVVVVVVDVVVVVKVVVVEVFTVVVELLVSMLRGWGSVVVVLTFSGDFLQPELILTKIRISARYFDMSRRL